MEENRNEWIWNRMTERRIEDQHMDASRCWLARTLCSCALKLNHFLVRAFDFFFEKEFVLFLCCWHSPLYARTLAEPNVLLNAYLAMCLCLCHGIAWSVYLFPSSPFSMQRVSISQRLSEIDLRMNRWQQQRRWRRRRQTFPKKKRKKIFAKISDVCFCCLYSWISVNWTSSMPAFVSYIYRSHSARLLPCFSALSFPFGREIWCYWLLWHN